MYYPVMPSLVTKIKNGRPYLYWVRSARVNGKPRIVEQVYLGPKDRVLEEIKQAYTQKDSPGPSPLHRVQVKEFGASALLWHWAERLQLAQIVDRHVPPPDRRRRTSLSVGQYLMIAALNRAIDVRSKRALYEDWYQRSVLSRLLRAKPAALSSQRFWDHMDQVEPHHIEAIQRDLLKRLGELFELGPQTVLYDTTNFYSFIDTFNQHCELPQRGANKQKRTDLRQLSLALFEDEQTALPLYHQCYAGDRPDVSQFGDAWSEMLRAWMGALERLPEQLTLVFDAGSTSKENLLHLEAGSVHYVGAIPPGWVPELLAIELKLYTKLTLPGTKHLKVYRSRQPFWGVERTLLVMFSPTLYATQRATMNRQQQQADAKLQELAAAIDRWNETRRGKGFKRSIVEKKIARWNAREHLREYLDVELETHGQQVVRLTWRWNRDQKRQVQRRWLGKRILLTDNHHWDDLALVTAYRRLSRTEHLFRLSKARRGPWWPMFHWTDSKIRVHALYCHFALLLLAIVQHQLHHAGLTICVDRAIHHLQQIQEALVLYTNGQTDRVLSQMDPIQNELAQTLGLDQLARQMGTTPLTAQ